MIGCEDATRQMWEYLDGVIGGDDRALIEEHLSRCLRCCGERDFAIHLRRFLANNADQPMPAEVATRLGQIVEELA